MSITTLLLYLTTHHLSLEAGALGAGYEVLKACNRDPALADLVKRWQAGEASVLDDLAMQLICEHPAAVDALTGEISALAHACQADAGLKPRLWDLIKK